MNFHVTGLNHTTAPVDVRERLAFAPERLADAMAGLRNAEGLLETMVLSTCNRVEITATADDACDARDRIEAFLSGYHNVERD